MLIESKTPTRPSLPVRERNVYARPLQRPVVEAVVSNRGDGEPILASDTILVRGHGVAGEITRVTISEAAPAPTTIADADFAVPLAGTALRAGVQPLRVVHRASTWARRRVHIAAPSRTRSRSRSLPRSPPRSPSRSRPTAPGCARATLSFDVAPPLAPGQHAMLLLNELLPTGAPPDAVARGFSFPAGPLTASTPTLTFPVSALSDATYLVRVRVDGVESPIAIDPATGRFDTPKVVIP